jgi:molybdopterin converting factor small subunit
MHIHVELLGISRLLAGTKTVLLDLQEGATLWDVVHALSVRYPALIGDVIHPDGKTLYPPHVFNLNAKRMIQENQMDERLSDGDRITLMSILAGG